MIVLSNSQAQTIAVGGTVTFDTTVLHTGCRSDGCGGAEYHRNGSGTVQLRPGIYEISFNGNITSGTADQAIQMSVAINGTPLPETTMIQTVVAANSYGNIAASTYLRVCCGTSASISVENNGANELTLATGSALSIRRVA